MRRVIENSCKIILGVALLGAATGCAKTEYVGNNAKEFWSDQPAKISPNQAYQKAMPHLAATWEARCEHVRNHDAYCDQLTIDHMMRKGKFYYVTRTSYPYKNHSAFLEYAVKVNSDTGEVIPLKSSGASSTEAAESDE